MKRYFRATFYSTERVLDDGWELVGSAVDSASKAISPIMAI